MPGARGRAVRSDRARRRSSSRRAAHRQGGTRRRAPRASKTPARAPDAPGRHRRRGSRGPRLTPRQPRPPPRPARPARSPPVTLTRSRSSAVASMDRRACAGRTRSASATARALSASSRAWTVGAPAGTGAKASSAGRSERVPPATPDRRSHQRRNDGGGDELGRRVGQLLGTGLGGLEAKAGIRGIVERLGEWRLPVPCRLLGPSLPPRVGGGDRHLLVRSCEPHERPRPGHDPVRVVAPATRRQPAATRPTVRDRVDDPCRGPHRGGGDPEVRQRIERVRVGAVLRHHDVGPEGRRQRRHQQPDRIQPRPLTRSPAPAAR